LQPAASGKHLQSSLSSGSGGCGGGQPSRVCSAHLRRALCEKINKKNKNANVKPFMVKNHLWIFINTQIENPAFDSQVRLQGGFRHKAGNPACLLAQRPAGAALARSLTACPVPSKRRPRRT
jgi:hypothetical protein